ncbi:DEAD/DEAH box helicase [Candidatus Kuenenia sp.]|uniref:DEAD/DEAH box helicase n=1 Tax=Candidatus Kuenenia sp. TaxID=2499824 RepID=UPI00322092C5
MKNFQAFNFNSNIVAGIESVGYVTPTPIQLQAIPLILEGTDVMGLAQTGTGKTAAFVLPILHRLMQGERGKIRALVVVPTRELAEQVLQDFKTLGSKTSLRSISIYGGVSITQQINRLRSGVEIVVACPGRLLDHMKQRTIDLSKVEVLVLDEADHMFDMGFLPDIRKIIKCLSHKRQTLLFSATMPDEIRKLAQEALTKPVTVQLGKTAPASTVKHALYPVKQHLKIPLLLKILQHTDTQSVLIFTRTKYRAKSLGDRLIRAGYKATSFQGNLSQPQRQAALGGFRNGAYQILVATDIAARGIDISQISHVINYDIPDTPEAYVHRIGRTGRAARTGDAFTLVTEEDKAMVRSIENILGSRIERYTLENFDYSVPALKNTGTHVAPTQKKIVRNKMDWHQKRDIRGKTDLKKDMSTSTMKKQYSFIKTKTTRPLSANIKTAPRPLKHK